MYLAFYKATALGATWLDRAIAWWTGSNFSHVELVFGDGACFSASPRDHGTRYKVIDLSDSATWDAAWLDIPPAVEERIRYWCDSQVNKPYATRAIFGFVLWTGTQRGAWFCSEVCLQAIQLHGLLTDLKPQKTSPGKLHDAICPSF